MMADRNKLMLKIKEHRKQSSNNKLQDSWLYLLSLAVVIRLWEGITCCYTCHSRGHLSRKALQGTIMLKEKSPLCSESVASRTRPWLECRTLPSGKPSAVDQSQWSREGHWEGRLLEGSRKIRTDSLEPLVIRKWLVLDPVTGKRIIHFGKPESLEIIYMSYDLLKQR